MAILGLPDLVFFLWQSAIFYMLSIFILIKTFIKQGTRLLDAFYIYLEGMALMHIFLGLAFLVADKSDIFFLIAFMSAVAGSAYTTKFPLYSEYPKYEKRVFYPILILGIALVAYSALIGKIATLGLTLTMLYMIVFAGYSSLYIINVSRKQTDASSRVKGVGGGLGMFLCCGIADALVLLGGLDITINLVVYRLPVPEFLMALSPVVIMASIFYGRSLEKQGAGNFLLEKMRAP